MADDQFFIISHGDSSGTDEDFVLVTDDDGFPTDDSDEDDSDEDDSDASVRGDEIEKNRQGPIAPKRTLSAFMFFAQAERENTKKENPGIAIIDLGRVLGEKWRSMSAEEKEPYEEKARADAARYMAQRADLDSENETDSE